MSYSKMDYLDVEIAEAESDVKTWGGQYAAGYADGMRRARELCRQHIKNLSALVHSQTELAEAKKLLASQTAQ